MHPYTAAKFTRVIGVVLMIYALIWGTAPYAPIDAPARGLLDVLAWPVADNTPVWDANLVWMSSIGAGLLMALGVLFFGVIAPAIHAGHRHAATTTIAAMTLWFVIDSAGSIAAGFTANAVINLITLVPMLLPLILVKWDSNA